MWVQTLLTIQLVKCPWEGKYKSYVDYALMRMCLLSPCVTISVHFKGFNAIYSPLLLYYEEEMTAHFALFYTYASQIRPTYSVGGGKQAFQ